MTPLEVMEARLAELRTENDALYEKRGRIIDTAAAEKRSFTDAEQADYDAAGAKREQIERDIVPVKARVEELRALAARDDAAAGTRRIEGDSEHRTPATVKDAPIYTSRGETGQSYFRDLYAATVHGSGEARERLIRNSRMAQAETRALGNTGAVGGSGGEFAPPLWLVDQFVALARPGRVFANLVNNEPLPEGVSSVNIPRILTGTTTAVQTTQNTALSQTDLTTGAVSSGVVTIGGKQLVSQQLLDQSAIPFDRVIMADLAADYARQLDVQFIVGSGTGQTLRGVSNGSGVGATTYTQATPAVAGAGGFYATLAKAIAAVETTRYLPPTAIVMHPRRWGWIAASFDANNRPLLPMGTPSFNAVGDDAPGLVAQGAVGTMQGLPVYTDANIPTNTGAGTNQDPVFVLRKEDLYLWESPLRMQAFDQPYADSAGVLFRALGYSAAVPDRYGASVNVINGTGLVTPTY